MSLAVPGVGLVTVRWLPASDEDFKDLSEGGRSGYQPIAICHHRGVVNSLASLDMTFAHGDADPATVGSPGRPVSAHFGIGDIAPGVIGISQYVRLQETAYCNGDCQQTQYPGQPSNWDGWYGHKAHNERTVSIEHDDNGGSADPAVKGLVTEAIIRTSIELDRLLLSGNLAAITAAGIKCDQATATALGKIVPSTKTLISHNDIAGKLKPYCWRPWQADKIGFPRARYIAALTAAPAPPQEEDVPVLSSYTPGYTATIKATANVRSEPHIAAGTLIRTLAATEVWAATGWVKGDVDPDSNSDQWLCRWAGGRWEYTAKNNVTAIVAPPTAADLAAAKDAGGDAEYARQKAGATVALLPRP